MEKKKIFFICYGRRNDELAYSIKKAFPSAVIVTKDTIDKVTLPSGESLIGKVDYAIFSGIDLNQNVERPDHYRTYFKNRGTWTFAISTDPQRYLTGNISHMVHHMFEAAEFLSADKLKSLFEDYSFQG